MKYWIEYDFIKFRWQIMGAGPDGKKLKLESFMTRVAAQATIELLQGIVSLERVEVCPT